VRGVRVEGPAGLEELDAPATLLTTGGYAANRALVARMQPRWGMALTGCLDHATGDGQLILQDRFGTPLVLGDLYVPTMGMIEDPDRPGFGLRLAEARLIVDANARGPWELWVNRGGERFVAEDTPSPHEREHALLDQPGLAMAAVWDDHAVRHGPPAIGPDWTRSRELEEASRGRWLHRASSLTELAAPLGVDPGGLQRAVERYNQDLDDGRADALGRRFRPAPIASPPFYGTVSRGGMLLSRGGPAVDAELRPLRADGRPVQGIRLAGELLGMSQFSGDAFAGGMSIGPALSLGRWAVQQLVTADTLSSA
jgi:fumarate reductase flavoprotein subunit